jgi:hypothetical protein
MGTTGRFASSRIEATRAPVAEREVTFTNRDVSLAGSLILPQGTSRYPAVVFAPPAPDADVTARILPNADHTFRLPPGPSGWPATAPGYLPALTGWLRERR